MKVIICGTYDWHHYFYLEHLLHDLRRETEKVKKKLLVITSGTVGVETYVNKLCKKKGIDLIIHPPVNVDGEYAFLRRNEIILRYHKPDLVICVSRRLESDHTLLDLLERARAKSIPTRAIDVEYLKGLY